jgi:D-alanyl-D-alanine dipeptidase
MTKRQPPGLAATTRASPPDEGLVGAGAGVGVLIGLTVGPFVHRIARLARFTGRLAAPLTCLLVAQGVTALADAAPGPPKGCEPCKTSDLVELTTLEPTIRIDVRYATANNFAGRAFYSEARVFLQRAAAEALVSVHHRLAQQGYGLIVYDGYRPWSVTKLFWDLTPPAERAFVANPSKGSPHNRGCAVDLGLVDLRTGSILEMPSAWDEASERSFITYAGGTVAQRSRRDLLRKAMEEDGTFFVYPEEWWHYTFKDFRDYPIQDIPFSAIRR